MQCPVCGVRLRNADVFAHLASGDCPGDAGARHGEASSSVASGEMVSCPICDASVPLSELDAHIEAGCGSPATAEAAAPSTCADSSSSSSSHGTASTSVAECAREGARMDRLAQEMRCSLCFDLFDDPHSLPCQHSFCHECILGCFRVTSVMQCPLCKAPTWRRQVTQNHTLAAIVQAFREVAPEAG